MCDAVRRCALLVIPCAVVAALRSRRRRVWHVARELRSVDGFLAEREDSRARRSADDEGATP